MYRVLSGSDDVIYVFSADSDEEAELLARQICVAAGGPPSPRAGTTPSVRVEGLVGQHWTRVSAWTPVAGAAASGSCGSV